MTAEPEGEVEHVREDGGDSTPPTAAAAAAEGVPRQPEVQRGRGGRDRTFGQFLFACVGCCGIVFGDVGTSPIYAFREAFASRAFPASQGDRRGGVGMSPGAQPHDRTRERARRVVPHLSLSLAGRDLQVPDAALLR